MINPNHGLSPFSRRALCAVLMALVANPPAMTALRAAEGNAAITTGALSVASDPVGANVFVDGRFAGRTPLALSSVTLGDHRVRIVKDGYLENMRVVNVGSGQPRTLDVKLTKTSGGASAGEASAAQVSGGGGGSKKWLWIGLAAAGGGGALAYTMMNRNKPPVAGTVSVSPAGTGLAGFTIFSFTAGASDPDRDPLTITWNLGDGSTATGASATRVYAAAGTFSVSYTASDGKETVTAPAVTVTVGRSLTGTWTGGVEPGFNDPFSINVTQSGTALTGSTSFSGGTVPGLTGSLTGTTYPVTVTYTQTYTVTGLGTVTDSFTGTSDASGSTLTGTMTVTLPVGFVFTATNSRTATGPVTLRR